MTTATSLRPAALLAMFMPIAIATIVANKYGEVVGTPGRVIIVVLGALAASVLPAPASPVGKRRTGDIALRTLLVAGVMLAGQLQGAVSAWIGFATGCGMIVAMMVWESRHRHATAGAQSSSSAPD